jgi:hypothetical protein
LDIPYKTEHPKSGVNWLFVNFGVYIYFKPKSALLFFQRKMAVRKTDSGKKALDNSMKILALFF